MMLKYHGRWRRRRWLRRRHPGRDNPPTCRQRHCGGRSDGRTSGDDPLSVGSERVDSHPISLRLTWHPIFVINGRIFLTNEDLLNIHIFPPNYLILPRIAL